MSLNLDIWKFLAVVLCAWAMMLAPVSAQNAFAPSEAGKGRKCYFGECNDSSESGSVPNERVPTAGPAPTKALPPPPNPTKVSPTPSLPSFGGANFADEATDFGVQPQSLLQSNVGSATPRTIPGGRVVTTDQLRNALSIGKTSFVLVDSLDGVHATISGAHRIPNAGSPGNFNDAVQAQLFLQLYQLTGGNPAYPIVFFCEGSRCWESYNAALRAMRMGFSNVYWYRGGISAWQAAGLPMGSN